MLLVQTSPPLVKTHTSNPAFPTGGGLRGFVFCGGVERRDHPLKGGWSHSLPVGDSGDVVFCLVLAGKRLVRLYCVYSFVNFFCRNVRRDIG